MNSTILIVGLGNPGKEYDSTRHNIGFSCVEQFCKSQDEFQGWHIKKDLKCQINIAQMSDKRVMVIKPITFMNNSGEGVAAVTNFYKIHPDSIVVIHDELDINFGQIRSRVGGSDAGHNGVKSISEALGTENYGRIRIGIGPKKPASIDSKDFVLKSFQKEEASHMTALYKEVNAILSEHIFSTNPLPSDTRSFII